VLRILADRHVNAPLVKDGRRVDFAGAFCSGVLNRLAVLVFFALLHAQT
jgi:hypothetical protein